MYQTIEVLDGICTGRNGTVEIKGLAATPIYDGKAVRIDCISKVRGVMLNGGFTCDREAARNLAFSILDSTK